MGDIQYPLLVGKKMLDAITSGQKVLRRAPICAANSYAVGPLPKMDERYAALRTIGWQDKGGYMQVDVPGQPPGFIYPRFEIGQQVYVPEAIEYSLIKKRWVYSADDARVPLDLNKHLKDQQEKGQVKNKIEAKFAPREAVRTEMTVIHVAIEPLHAMDAEQARMEGFTGADPLAEFQAHWDRYIAPNYPYESNPLVWVVRFELNSGYRQSRTFTLPEAHTMEAS